MLQYVCIESARAASSAVKLRLTEDVFGSKTKGSSSPWQTASTQTGVDGSQKAEPKLITWSKWYKKVGDARTPCERCLVSERAAWRVAQRKRQSFVMLTEWLR